MSRILVVGCGSIGRRHINNLKALGESSLFTYDTWGEQLRRVAEETGATAVPDLDAALGQGFDLVLICTPPSTHVEIATKAIRGGANLFIEKPIGNLIEPVLELLDEARRAGRFICVGYNLRFHRGVRMLKDAIARGEIGKPLMVRAEVGQYLPDWRPQTDYRTGYNASAAMGGGIILDASHEIDYVRWLAGEVSGVSCMAGHLSSLEIEVEDAAAITLRMASGAIAEIHLDSIQRAYSRNCKVIGEEGTLVWEYGREFRAFRASDRQWTVVPLEVDPNEMYLEQTKHLLDCLSGKAVPLADGADGARVLEIALAARESARIRQEIKL